MLTSGRERPGRCRTTRGVRDNVTDQADLSSDADDPTAALAGVGVVGGGTMGSGIVHSLLAAGLTVVLVESDEAALSRAGGLVRASLQGAADRGKLAQGQSVDGLLTQLTETTDRSRLRGCGLVIEAVPEILDLKRTLLADVEGYLDPDAVLATNTSSLSLELIGESLQRPGRFLGTHFFNPVPVQKLLEMVRTDRTDEDALALVRALGARLGKTVVEVRDSPGFATSRLGVLVGLEAIRMVQEGVASPQDIDTAMELGYRYPMGPCRLGDLVGHDVRLGIAEYLASTLGPRFDPPQLLRDMVAEGKLGKKSGQGFYTWS